MVSVINVTDARKNEEYSAFGFVRIQKRNDTYHLKLVVYVPIDYEDEDDVKEETRIVCFAGSYHEDSPLAADLEYSAFEIDEIRMDLENPDVQLNLLLKIKSAGSIAWVKLDSMSDSVYANIPIESQYEALMDEEDMDETLLSFSKRLDELN